MPWLGDDFGHQITLLGDFVMANEDLLLTWQRNPQSPAIKEDLWMSVEARLPSQRVLKRLSERRLANYFYPNHPLATRRGGDRANSGAGTAPNWLLSGYQLYITVFDPQGDLAGLDVFDTDVGTRQTVLYYLSAALYPARNCGCECCAMARNYCPECI